MVFKSALGHNLGCRWSPVDFQSFRFGMKAKLVFQNIASARVKSVRFQWAYAYPATCEPAWCVDYNFLMLGYLRIWLQYPASYRYGSNHTCTYMYRYPAAGTRVFSPFQESRDELGFKPCLDDQATLLH